MSPVTIKIFVPKWMKIYLISQSENKCEPIEFPRRHEYNTLLIRLVTNRSDVKEERSKESFVPVKIKLPFSKAKDVYFYNKLSEEARGDFRDQVKTDFLFDFSVNVKDKLLKGVQRKIAIEQFFEYHKITDEDTNTDSFYRKFTRYIDKRKITA